MPYSSGDEYLSVAFVGVSRPPCWFYATWTPIARSLDRLILELGLKTAVRTTQSENGAQLRFGRLSWGEQSERKWTHGSPETKGKSAAWKFMAGEVWCPHWTDCARSKTNPSLFLSLANPFILGEPKEGQFNQMMLLAMPTTLFRRHLDAVSPAIATIRQQLAATDCVMRVTPWNLNYDSIQGALSNHVQYAGSANDMRFDVARTDGKWVPYDPAAIVSAAHSQRGR